MEELAVRLAAAGAGRSCEAIRAAPQQACCGMTDRPPGPLPLRPRLQATSLQTARPCSGAPAGRCRPRHRHPTCLPRRHEQRWPTIALAASGPCLAATSARLHSHRDPHALAGPDTSRAAQTRDLAARRSRSTRRAAPASPCGGYHVQQGAWVSRTSNMFAARHFYRQLKAGRPAGRLKSRLGRGCCPVVGPPPVPAAAAPVLAQ